MHMRTSYIHLGPPWTWSCQIHSRGIELRHHTTPPYIVSLYRTICFLEAVGELEGDIFQSYHGELAHHFLQRVRRTDSICEAVVISANCGHGDVCVTLNVTNGGNLPAEAGKRQQKLGRDEMLRTSDCILDGIRARSSSSWWEKSSPVCTRCGKANAIRARSCCPSNKVIKYNLTSSISGIAWWGQQADLVSASLGHPLDGDAGLSHSSFSSMF
jgi:hypothetical protein